MAIVETIPERIDGPWDDGWVLSKHIIRSVPIGYVGEHMQFDTLRTPLGELVHQFKNRTGSPEDIVETALDFIRHQWRHDFDGVVSMPPSIRRFRQPGAVLAAALAQGLGTEVRDQVVAKPIATLAIKNLARPTRAQVLANAIVAGTQRVDGMTILMVDDLWETGATMRRVADVVRAQGATGLYALALTRTK